MGHGVFIHRADSIYDDSPAERYQFPVQYLDRVHSCVGDWIVYYEPRKVVKTRGYFAVAKVQAVIPDPGASRMYIAVIEPGTYLDFANPVPFRGPDGLSEQGVLNAAGRISGRAQAAVREMSPADFRRIVDLGIGEVERILPRVEEVAASYLGEMDQEPFDHEHDRERVSFLTTRFVRDQIFRRVVLRAHDERCVVTGLKLINGAGRAEVAAAHIRPVEANGPDIVTNGIALSGTAHWMFDRGLISLADDLEILISRQVNDTDAIRAMINGSGRALEPQRKSDRPHPHFLNWHREHCFKH